MVPSQADSGRAEGTSLWRDLRDVGKRNGTVDLDDGEQTAERMGNDRSTGGVSEPIRLKSSDEERGGRKVFVEAGRRDERFIVGQNVWICLEINRNSSWIEKVMRYFHGSGVAVGAASRLSE